MRNKKEAKDFWSTLPRPFFALAPLADVTDPAFRRVIADYSKPHGPDVMYTEFVSADGLFLGGREIIERNLAYGESERPIVAQFFTAKPEMMERAASFAREHLFDGVDINMGCPDRSVERQGAGAALIKNPNLARELIAAARTGAGDLPVSVKTRIGYNHSEVREWIGMLLGENLRALTIHARTRKEMSKVPAHWEAVAEGVALRDELSQDTLIIGNGDVVDTDDASRKAEEYGCDGVMLGRAIFGRPWLFDRNIKEKTKEEKLKVLLEHARLFEELLPHKNFSIMKKHFKAYVSGWDGAKELRSRLMETGNSAEVERIVIKYT